jgi:hypothetical protein
MQYRVRGVDMQKLAIVIVALLLASCTGGAGFDSVRQVEDTKLEEQTIEAVVEMLGSPYAYYADPDGREHILVYDTSVTSSRPNLFGCLLLLGLAGGGDCPEGGYNLQHCVSLWFDRDKRLIDIDRPIWSSGPCSAEHDGRFLPAVPRPIEEVQSFRLDAAEAVLSEQELLVLFAGNTAFNSMYSEYYEPPAGAKKEGGLRGKHKVYGIYAGNWSVAGRQICLQVDRFPGPAPGTCHSITKHGDTYKRFDADGFESYPYGGRIQVTAGNPDHH